MYPEIEKAGSLGNALDIEFTQIKSFLRVDRNYGTDKAPLTYAVVLNNDKFSEVYTAVNEKLYVPDFWRDGVCLANGSTSDIAQLIKSIDFWLRNDVTTEELTDKYSFIKPTAKSSAFDEGKEVEFTWNVILNDNSRKELKEFVNLAINDEILSKLFPYISLNALCFSHSTGYPYTTDIPVIIPVAGNRFEVRTHNQNLIGIGTAVEALQLVKDNLPLNIGPAVKGTAESI